MRTAGETGTLALDEVPLPARHHVDAWRRQYACLAHRPAWLVETARGCPFRCSFCSIWQLHARAVRERSIDARLPRLRVGRRPRLRRRRSVLASPVAQPRAGARAAAARHPQAVDSGAEPRRSRWRGIPSCSKRGGRSRSDFDIFFGLEAATNEGLDGLMKDATVDADRAGRRGRARARLRRHRQLRDRSGVGRGGLRAAVGVRRAPSAVPGRLHDPDAAARHGVLRGDAADAARAPVVAFRHAPSAVGAGARPAAVLRAVLRDVAAIGAEPARPQERSGSGCARWIRATRCSCCRRCGARSA